MKTAEDILKEGGAWLGAARSWLQCRKRNGEHVKWGSQDVLDPPMTVRECEEMVAEAIQAERKAYGKIDPSMCLLCGDIKAATSDGLCWPCSRARVKEKKDGRIRRTHCG
jgi:hypothetical protein